MKDGVMRLAALNVYPIKSCGAISPDTWPVDGFGLSHDRRWMVTDPQGRFLTQREEPTLALVHVSISGMHLTLAAAGMGALVIPLAPTGGASARVLVWRDWCDAWEPDRRASEWFSEWLQRPVRLVYMPPGTYRPVDRRYATTGRVSFADAFPFLLIGSASLRELNRRLAQPVPMTRFRPNLVVEGFDAFAEDHWKVVRIGDLTFDVGKPCARCVVTTTDQDTAERHPMQEPLRTLATYRRRGSDVLFGQNLAHRMGGTLRVGDRVQVLERAGAAGASSA